METKTRSTKIIEERLSETASRIAKEINENTDRMIIDALNDGHRVGYALREIHIGKYSLGLCSLKSESIESLSKLVTDSWGPIRDLEVAANVLKKKYSYLECWPAEEAEIELEHLYESHENACYHLASLKPWGEE